MTLKYSDIALAFDMTNFDGMIDAAAVISRSESKIYIRDSMGDIDEIPEDAEDGEDFVWLPDKMDLDLGSRLVFRFVEKEIPDKIKKVRMIFGYRGAYGRYKEFLSEQGLLDKWYTFEEEQSKKALLNWCKTNEIEVEED